MSRQGITIPWLERTPWTNMISWGLDGNRPEGLEAAKKADKVFRRGHRQGYEAGHASRDEEVKRLRALLVSLEWHEPGDAPMGAKIYPKCLICHGIEPEHLPGCKLRAALKGDS